MVHSTFSDGSLTPEELVRQGNAIGLKALSLTDHDCVDGIERFMAACAGSTMEGIPGVEISAEVKHGTMHILGYFIDPADGELEHILIRIRNGRETRNRRILEKLRELGMDLTWEEVSAFAGEDLVGLHAHSPPTGSGNIPKSGLKNAW